MEIFLENQSFDFVLLLRPFAEFSVRIGVNIDGH
jgi:hypothetical protein